jgi:hypothetical protein
MTSNSSLPARFCWRKVLPPVVWLCAARLTNKLSILVDRKEVTEDKITSLSISWVLLENYLPPTVYLRAAGLTRERGH